MDVREYGRWQALRRRRPCGEEALDLRFAMLGRLMVGAYTGEWLDIFAFLPPWWQMHKSAEDLHAKLRAADAVADAIAAAKRRRTNDV